MAIEGLAISPDGRVVAFQYHDGESKRHGLGLLEWESGKLTSIPRLPGMPHLGSATFSPDGKRLIAMASAAASGQIVSIDLATLQITKLAEARKGWQKPVLQPGTDNILLVKGGPGVFYHLILLDPKAGTETPLIEEKNGFTSGLYTPSFVGRDEIVFGALSPMDPQLIKSVLDIVPHVTEDISYRLKFGGRPEIILGEITANKASPTDRGVSSISASGDGKVLAFIAKSREEPRDEHGFYNLEIFIQKDGKIKQMTNLRSHMAYATMSRDGTTVVFGAKSDRRGPRGAGHEFYILDLRTSKVTPTGLKELLQQRADFRLP